MAVDLPFAMNTLLNLTLLMVTVHKSM
jgi:hypothetical protein